MPEAGSWVESRGRIEGRGVDRAHEWMKDEVQQAGHGTGWGGRGGGERVERVGGERKKKEGRRGVGWCRSTPACKDVDAVEPALLWRYVVWRPHKSSQRLEE